MYFDDVVARNTEVKITFSNGKPVYLKDAVPFKFSNELFLDAVDYWKGKTDPPKLEIDYARTPYQSVFLHFGGVRGYWVIGNDLPEIKAYNLMLVAYDRFSDWSAAKFKARNLSLENIKYNPEDEAMLKNVLKFNLMPRLITATLHYGEGSFSVHSICGQPVDNNTEMKEPLLSYMWIFQIVIRVLTLLNCTNIKKIKHPAPGPKLQKKRKRKGKLPISSYYTLEIDLQENREHKSGLMIGDHHNRVHLCRGHFKRYTEENPLFGRFIGLWWWGPHARGRNRDGVIHKNYAVIN